MGVEQKIADELAHIRAMTDRRHGRRAFDFKPSQHRVVALARQARDLGHVEEADALLKALGARP